MRTYAAAWAAALAVMSITGPFTTAEAAPARPIDAEEPRPIFHQLEKKQFLNETASTIRTRDPDPGIIPLLGGSSSVPPPDPTPNRNAPKHNHLSVVPNLLSQGLLPGSSSFLPSSSSSIPAPPRGNAKSKDDSRKGGATKTTDNDPLLGSITGALPNILPHTSSSDNIIVGLTTVLHHSLPTAVPVVNSVTKAVNSDLSKATGKDGIGHLTHDVGHGALSKLTGTGGVVGGLTSDLTKVVPTKVTQPVGSVLSKVTGTGGVPGVVSNINSDLSKVNPSGITGVGTGIVPIVTPDVTSILSSVQSEVTSVVAGLPTATKIVPALESSLQGKLSSIQATITNPAVVSALSSGFSSILSSVGSSLNGTLPAVGSIVSDPTAPIGSILSNPTSGVGSIVSSLTGALSIPTGGITITGAGTTVVVPVPTSTGLPTGLTTVLPGAGTTTGTSDGTASTAHGTGVAGGSTAATSTVSTTENSQGSTSTASSNSTTLTQSAVGTTTSTPTDTTKNGPLVSIKPTATDTQTSMSLPTVWTFAPGSATKEVQGGIQTASSATASSGGLPTYLPQLVQPAGGSPAPGSNFTLVQVGFKFGLNYPFVVSRPESASQIFTWLPQGLAYGLGIPEENILMNALVPYNTAAKLGFVTTLAQAYIPANLVNQLQLDLHTAASPLYDPPTTRIKQLMQMINPTIPLIPGTSLDGVPEDSAFDVKAAAGAGEGTGSGAPIGGDSGNSSKVRGTSVGIGAGAVAGAAVYAAAMMYVARRYRQKRKGHHRVSSVPAAGEMTQRSSGGMGSLFMSGANGRGTTRGSLTGSNGRNSRTSHTSSNGRSVREQGISAPLMSENSLGWN